LNYFSIASLSTVAFGLIKILLFYDIENTSRILSEGHLEFTEVISGIHPTYLSMYFILISFYSLEELRHANFSNGLKSWLQKLIYLISSVAALVFLRSQMALMVFTTVVVFYLLVITRKRAWLIAFFLFTVGLITLLLDSEGTLSQLSYYGKNVSTALDSRVILWKAVINGLKGNVLFGAGTGGEQALINEGYRQASFSEGLENSFNAHNQYLQFVCRNGLIELGAFLALLIYCFWKAQQQQNLIFMLFLISFSLLMLTESCLNTQRGIVFFYFFVSVFVFLPDKSDETAIHPTLDKSII
jgi:O-antigen ligase